MGGARGARSETEASGGGKVLGNVAGVSEGNADSHIQELEKVD